MKKLLIFVIFILFISTISAYYQAPYDEGDENIPRYITPNEEIGKSPLAYDQTPSTLKFINWVIPTLKNINLTGGSFISIIPDPNTSTITIDGSQILGLIAGANFSFFLSNNASAISDYNFMYPAVTGDAQSTDTNTITADATLISNSITETTQPTFTVLSAGVYSLHVHAFATTAGKKTSRFYFEFYKRTAGGVETLLITSEESDILTNASAAYEVHGTLVTDADLNSTDRLVVKIYGNLESATGGDPDITIEMEGSTASRLEVKTTITAFDERYWSQPDLNNFCSDVNHVLAFDGAGGFNCEQITGMHIQGAGATDVNHTDINVNNMWTPNNIVVGTDPNLAGNYRILIGASGTSIHEGGIYALATNTGTGNATGLEGDASTYGGEAYGLYASGYDTSGQPDANVWGGMIAAQKYVATTLAKSLEVTGWGDYPIDIGLSIHARDEGGAKGFLIGIDFNGTFWEAGINMHDNNILNVSDFNGSGDFNRTGGIQADNFYGGHFLFQTDSAYDVGSPTAYARVMYGDKFQTSANSYLDNDELYLYDAVAPQGYILKNQFGFLNIDMPTSGTDAAWLRFFRGTNTSGTRRIYVYKGDGSATASFYIDAGTQHTYSLYFQPLAGGTYKSDDGTTGVTGSLYIDEQGSGDHTVNFKDGLYVGTT